MARIAEFRAGVEWALAYARALDVCHLNCLAGRANPAFSLAAHWETLAENVRFTAKVLGQVGLHLTVEPVNRRDVPLFVVGTMREAPEPNQAHSDRRLSRPAPARHGRDKLPVPVRRTGAARVPGVRGLRVCTRP